MERINAWATVNIAFMTFIVTGAALATYLVQFTKLSNIGLFGVIIFYIVVILLYALGSWRVIK